MINKKSFIIISIFMLFTASNVFASNIGRAVYGVLTETYNGVAINNSSAGADYANNWGSPQASSDRIEGASSTSVGSQWWFGVTFNTAQNMSAYSGGRMYFSAKVPTAVIPSNSSNVIKVSDGNDKSLRFDSTNIKRIDNGNTILGTGIVNDNDWHTYYIDLSSFSGLNFSNITYLFIVGTTANNNTLLIDNVYWTKSSSSQRSFDVKIKKVSDNSELSSTSPITWNDSSFRQSWEVAEQYLELDLDYETTNNWNIQILLDNEGVASRNGLYATDTSTGNEYVLQMAWRVSRDTLPNSSGDTLQIKQDSNYKLYDSGKIYTDPAWWYPWVYFYEKTDPDLQNTLIKNNTVVWDIKGCHTFVYDNEAWDSLANFYERKPKIYLAANCQDAWGGLSYTANIEITLNLE